SSFNPEIAEQFFKIKILRLNCGEHFARRRNCPSVCSKISPHQRERDVSRCKPGLPLIKLDPGYLERLPLCLRDCLKIRVSSCKKDDRHVETVGRLGRIDIRSKRLRISSASFLEPELQVLRTLGAFLVLVSFSVD